MLFRSALIMRADIIHRSQLPLEHRVAMSIRCYNTRASINRREFFCGSRNKKVMIKNNLETYKPIMDAFANSDADTIYAQDILPNKNFL